MRISTVTIDPVEVLCVTAVDGLAGAKTAFERLESCFETLRGRRFYGALQREGTYRACAARRGGDDAAALGVDQWRLPGGRYARTKVAEWEDHLDGIGPAFMEMAAYYEEDPRRPSIEFYRSQKNLILLLPIREP